MCWDVPHFFVCSMAIIFWLVGSVVSLLLTSILPRASRSKPRMKRSHATCYIQGLNKVPFSCLGQVDFPSRWTTFYSHLANGQGIRNLVCHLNHLKSKLRLAKFESYLSQEQDGIQLLFFRALYMPIMYHQALSQHSKHMH